MRSRAHLSSDLPTVYSSCKSRITAYYVFHVQPADGHGQAPKHVVVPYVIYYLDIPYQQIRL